MVKPYPLGNWIFLKPQNAFDSKCKRFEVKSIWEIAIDATHIHTRFASFPLRKGKKLANFRWAFSNQKVSEFDSMIIWLKMESIEIIFLNWSLEIGETNGVRNISKCWPCNNNSLICRNEFRCYIQTQFCWKNGGIGNCITDSAN